MAKLVLRFDLGDGVQEEPFKGDPSDLWDAVRTLVEWNGAKRVDVVSVPKGYVCPDKPTGRFEF